MLLSQCMCILWRTNGIISRRFGGFNRASGHSGEQAKGEKVVEGKSCKQFSKLPAYGIIGPSHLRN